jgi:hypothetical protein
VPSGSKFEFLVSRDSIESRLQNEWCTSVSGASLKLQSIKIELTANFGSRFKRDISVVMNNVRDCINDAKGWFPLGLATVYVMGFVVVGLHLAGYGASSLDLIKSQYLAAGFWFCGSSLLYFGALKLMRSFVMSLIRTRPGFREVGGVRQRLLLSLFSNFVLAFLLCIFMFMFRFGHRLVPHLLVPRFKELDDSVLLIGLVSLPFAVLMAFLDIAYQLRAWFKERAAEQGRSSDMWTIPWLNAIIFIATFFLLSIKIFAVTIYRFIPFSLGGGEPRQVIFWLGPTTSPAESFVERDGSKSFSIPYELLVESENSLVVISPKEGQRAIEFDRKSVGAVIVLGKRPRTAPAHFQRGVEENVPTTDHVNAPASPSPQGSK